MIAVGQVQSFRQNKSYTFRIKKIKKTVFKHLLK